MTMVFDPAAPAFVAKQASYNNNFTTLLTNLGKKLNTILTAHNITFRELLVKTAVK